MVEMKFQQKLLMNWIRDLTTGHHTTIALNLKLWNFYFIVTRCLLVTSTLYLASEQLLLLLMMIQPPFSTSTEMYNTINTTPLGDIPWQSTSLQYDGAKPVSKVPSWMKSNYDIWFQDPHAPVLNLLSNPGFYHEFDYALLPGTYHGWSPSLSRFHV